MNMSYLSLNRLIEEFPEERETVSKLASFVKERSANGSKRTELTISKIFDLVNPKSQRVLAVILGRFVECGIFERFLRVESEGLGGIGDFPGLEDIPPVIYDIQTGRNVEVNLDQIRLIYRLNSSYRVE